MDSLRKDYRKLYLLQDKFLKWWSGLRLPFYLTGGTALGRFYLNHRYSEDLDFFVNDDSLFLKYIERIKNEIGKHFKVNLQHALFTDDFSRIFITENDLDLKIEFVNDVSYRAGNPVSLYFGLLDIPVNILSNKLGAIISREEPKDILDIVNISAKYSFNWQDIFYHSKQKSVINEIDVAERLSTFPVSLLENIDCSIEVIDPDQFCKVLQKIADDFLLGRENSVCSGINPIYDARPLKLTA